MSSFRCHDNSDDIATFIITNFHIFLIQLWWKFFQIFAKGDVVYAQIWELFTLKNPIDQSAVVATPPSHVFITYHVIIQGDSSEWYELMASLLRRVWMITFRFF